MITDEQMKRFFVSCERLAQDAAFTRHQRDHTRLAVIRWRSSPFAVRRMYLYPDD